MNSKFSSIALIFMLFAFVLIGGASASQEFNITAIDAYTSSAINSFNATVNDYTHTTTTGSIAFNTTTDWSGNNNWATVNGATYNSTYQSYEFLGSATTTGNYLYFPNVPLLSSYVIHIKMTPRASAYSAGTDGRPSLVFSDIGAANRYFGARNTDNCLQIYTSSWRTATTNCLTLDVEQDVFYMRNNTGVYVAINNASWELLHAYTTSHNIGVEVVLGTRTDSNGFGYNGTTRLFEIINGSMTTTEKNTLLDNTYTGEKILYLPFSRLDAAPDTTLVDRASYSRLATNNGATYNAAESAYEFDGNNRYIYTEQFGINLSEPFTLHFSVYPTLTGTKILFTDYSGGNGFFIRRYANYFRLNIFEGAADVQQWLTGSSTNMDLDTWTNITFVSDGTTMYVYKNGEYKTNTSYGGTGIVSSGYFYIANTAEDFVGSMRNVALYDAALSSSEIVDLNNGDMQKEGLFFYLPFTQDANTTINVTSSADNYFSRNYTNRETTSNLQTSLIANILGATVTEKISGAAVSSYTINTSGNGGSASNSTGNTLYLTAGNYTIDWSKSGYYPTSNSYEALGATSGATSFTVHNHILNLTLYDVVSQRYIEDFTVNLYSDDYTYSEQLTATNSTPNTINTIGTEKSGASDICPTYSVTNKVRTEDLEGFYSLSDASFALKRSGGTSVSARIKVTYADATTYTTTANTTTSTSYVTFYPSGWNQSKYVDTVEFQACQTGGGTWIITNTSLDIHKGNIISYELIHGNYTLYLNDSNYALTSYELQLNNTDNLTSYQMSAYTTNSVNFTFIDEQTGAIIDFENVTTYLTSTIQSYNFTTDDGFYYLDLISPQNYTITYSAPSYEQREYFFTLENRTSNELILYLLNSSEDTIITATVVNTINQYKPDHTIFVQRKNLSGTNYYTVDACSTNDIGECILHLELYDVTYRFTVLDSNGNSAIFKSTGTTVSSEQKIFSSTLTLVIDEQDDNVDTVFDVLRVSGDVTYTNSTENFLFTWVDASGLSLQGCLEVEKKVGSVTSTIYYSCQTSSSGTINYTINSSTGNAFTATGSIIVSGQRSILDTLTIVTNDFSQGVGIYGIFLFGFIIAGIAAFTGLWNPVVAPSLLIATIFFAGYFQFISLGLSITGVMASLLVLVIYVVKT